MIKFGTDGWRGVIADDFTEANAALVIQARLVTGKTVSERSPADGRHVDRVAATRDGEGEDRASGDQEETDGYTHGDRLPLPARA